MLATPEKSAFVNMFAGVFSTYVVNMLGIRVSTNFFLQSIFDVLISFLWLQGRKFGNSNQF